MAKNYTLERYKEIITRHKKGGYVHRPIVEYFMGVRDPKSIFMRHDVDRRPWAALYMASMEYSHRIRSTYYFRLPVNKTVVKQIHALVHEVGLHYEVMDKARGDIKKAGYLMEKQLRALRAYAPVYTVSAHGNPLTRHDNRDFFDFYNPKHFKLKGEASRMKVAYYTTDAGRGKINLKDQIQGGGEALWCLSIHPERWNDGFMWYYQWAFDLACNIGKKVFHARSSSKPILSA